MIRPFYCAIVCLLVLGCRDAATPSPNSEPSAGEIATTLDSIDQWIRAAQPDKGELIARAAVAKHPHVAAFHAQLGQILLIKSGAALAEATPDHAATLATEALTAFQEAFTRGDKRPLVLRSAGIAAEQAGNLTEAVGWYRLASPSDPSSTLYLALALLRIDNPSEAAITLEPLLTARPEDPFLNATHAECFAAQEDYAIALEAISKAIRLAPDEPAFRIRRAAILRQSGKPLDAAESLLAMGRAARETLFVTEELAAAYLAANQPVDAAQTWASFAKANPGDEHALIRTIESFIEAGELGEAQSWFDLLCLENPNHVERQRLAEVISAGAARHPVEE
jgi:tetratricopeptide (TPR) repeat protein